MKYEKYNKNYEYSYTLGTYPTIELLKRKAEQVVKIIIHSKFSGKEGLELIGSLASKAGIEVEQNDMIIQKISPKENCYVVGVFNKYELALKPAIDIFSPDTIRASMGALFGINFRLFENIEEYLSMYKERDIFSLMTDGESKLTETKFTKPFSIIFGNEASGLPQTYKQLGKTVRINCSKNVDSLNLAISTGIVLHYLYYSRKIYPTYTNF